METAQRQAQSFQDQLGLLDQEISVISESEISYVEYFRNFLEKIVAVLGTGGSTWQLSDNQLKCICHINQSVAGVNEDGPQFQLHCKAILKVFETGEGIILPAHGSSDLFDGGLGQEAINNSPYTLLYMPVKVSGETNSVFALISPEGVDPRAVRGYAGFVASLCEKAGMFIIKDLLKTQQAHTNRTDRLRNYVSALHSELDLKRCCYAMANYSQELLSVYRCTAGSYSHSGKFRVYSVSGLESVAVKSSMLKDLETICREVCKNNKPLIVDNPHAAMKAETAGSDNLVTAARMYMIQAGAVIMGIFPVKSPEGLVVGALVVEKALEEEFSRNQLQQIDALMTEAGIAIRNCQKYKDLPLQGPIRALATVRDKYLRAAKTRKVVIISILLALAILPFVIPKTVKVVGNSVLIANNTKYLYAQTDGIITSVSIPEERIVKAGDILARFDTRIIDTELTRIAGRIDEADIALRQARSKGLGEEARRLELGIMAMRAEQDKYKYLLENHIIKSPIDGYVTTRDSEIRELVNRPVQAGNLVLEVIPEQPTWEFQVHIPEDDAGNLLQAWHMLEEGQTLKARLLMKAYPEFVFDTEVISLSSKAHVQTTGEQKYRNVITAIVRQPEELKNYELRQAMEGKVAIECGDRSLFYALTHEFADFIRVNTF